MVRRRVVLPLDGSLDKEMVMYLYQVAFELHRETIRRICGHAKEFFRAMRFKRFVAPLNFDTARDHFASDDQSDRYHGLLEFAAVGMLYAGLDLQEAEALIATLLKQVPDPDPTLN